MNGLLFITQIIAFLSFISNFLKKKLWVLNTSDLSPANFFGLKPGTSKPKFLPNFAIFFPSVDK